MKKHKRHLRDTTIDGSWTLFLDRDGVINKRIIDGYVRDWSEFEFLPGVLDALKEFEKVGNRISKKPFPMSNY